MSRKKGLKVSQEKRFKKGALLCNAKGNTCGAFAMKGKEKCYSHGGASTGRPIKRFEEYLPEDLRQIHADVRADEVLASLVNERDYITAQILANLEQTKSPDGHAVMWRSAIESFNLITEAIKENNPDNLKFALKQHQAILKNGMMAERAQGKVDKYIDKKAFILSAETKREVSLNSVITARQFDALVLLVLGILSARIRDPDELRSAQGELIRALGAPDSIQAG